MKTTVIMGMLRDKEYKKSIEIMAGLADKFIAVRPDNPRALDPAEVAKTAERFISGTVYFENQEKALEEAAEYSGKDGAIIICGSLYMASKMRRSAENIFGKRLRL
jgi:dihydrofolate synthase/folylpolyglutamate synthase